MDSCFIQLPANFLTPATMGLHFGVLNGRSRASLIVRIPAEANARMTSSSYSGTMAYVRWRGEKSSASMTLSGGKAFTTSSASPSCLRRTETIAVLGSPEWSTAVSTILYISRMALTRTGRGLSVPAAPERITAARSPPTHPTTPSGATPIASMRRDMATHPENEATNACAYAPELKMSASWR